MTEKKMIVIPINCKTIKTLKQVLIETAVILGLVSLFVGGVMTFSGYYILTYVTPISQIYSPVYGHGIHIDDTGFYLLLVGTMLLCIGIRTWVLFISERYDFSCIKET